MKHWIFEGKTDPAAFNAEINIPGDKSVSHRAVMLGSLANGVTTVDGFLPGADTLATVEIFRSLGVRIEQLSERSLQIHGVGMQGLQASPDVLDCGNAGTAMRLLSGLLSAQPFDTVLTGDESLCKRPMDRVINPLTDMGARIESANGSPPLHLMGGQTLQGIYWQSPVASAQVKSAILLAGLFAQGLTRVEEPHPTRNYTEQMLRQMGWPLDFGPGYAELTGGHQLHATHIEVPGDFSSAAFLIVGATLMPGANLTVKSVGLNMTRVGLLHSLSLMGANISITNMRQHGDDRIGDITVRHATLEGVELPPEIVPDMIDEFPILFAAAACAQGATVIRGAAELRVKESDRIETMAQGLRAMGVRVETLPDGAVIHGNTQWRETVVDAHSDHRIAMSFAILAAAAGVATQIKDVANVATSFPEFEQLMAELGVPLAVTGD